MDIVWNAENHLFENENQNKLSVIYIFKHLIVKFLSKFVKISFVCYYFNIASIFLLATPVPEPASTTVGDISR